MNSAENGLSVLSQGVDEIKDGPRSLTIKTGGRLVEEQKQLGFGGQFDTDGKALALFDVQTCIMLEPVNVKE